MKTRIKVHRDENGKLQPSHLVSESTPLERDRQGQDWATVNIKGSQIHNVLEGRLR